MLNKEDLVLLIAIHYLSKSRRDVEKVEPVFFVKSYSSYQRNQVTLYSIHTQTEEFFQHVYLLTSGMLLQPPRGTHPIPMELSRILLPYSPKE